MNRKIPTLTFFLVVANVLISTPNFCAYCLYGKWHNLASALFSLSVAGFILWIGMIMQKRTDERKALYERIKALR